MRTDWRNSHPSTVRRHPTSRPPQTRFYADVESELLTIVTICKERERRGVARVEFFSGGGTMVLPGVVRRRSQ